MSQIGDPIRIVEVPEPVPVSNPDPSEAPVPDFVPDTWPETIPAEPTPAGAP